MSASPLPRFDFVAPDDHLSYYAEIATTMARRRPVSEAEAVAAVNERVRETDHFGPYAWLLFHEEPWYWADLYYHQQLPGNWGHRPRRTGPRQ
ncbi:hypothetical protein GXW82_33755 [Streptacidiphilus sp. 4-A2]|nr:hypothetical protein [Streptacidiphilus sp. 4-A2]